MENFIFYFNPKKRRDIILKSFCYSPSSKKECELGNLYLVIALNKPRKDYDNLSELLEIIKNEYYHLPERGAEISFKGVLEKSNDFLRKEREQQNDKWLEGLSLSIFSLTNDFFIYFSQKNGLKNILIRGEELFEIGEIEESESPTQKMFSNMVKGKLVERDKMLVLNQELFIRLREESLLGEIKDLGSPRELKRIFKNEKETLKEFFGVLLLIFIKKEKRKIYLKIPESVKKVLILILILVILSILGHYLF